MLVGGYRNSASAVKPITPQEAKKAPKPGIPDQVIECFNELIAKHFSGGSAHVLQDDVVSLICQRLDIRSPEVYKRGLLDVENHFKEAGWKVTYDKPGYDESYSAYFIFEG